MNLDINLLYQELIIDHGTKPRNHHELVNCTHTAEGFNPLCGDKVNLYLLVDKDLITDAGFVGNGCAISMASASIMTEMLIGKTITQALALFAEFHDLVTDNPNSSHTHETINLGKLQALAGVKAFPSRIKCATIAWHTLDAALKPKIK